MDLLEKMKRLGDKAMAKEIAHEAAERFCRDFEEVEELLGRAGAGMEGGGEGAEDEGDRGSGEEEGEGEKVEGVASLRDVYPRTSAEVRVLLS